MMPVSSKKILELLKKFHIMRIYLLKITISERIYMTFGEKLRQLRKRKKLTQEQMAELIEIHESHVGRYEKDLSSPTAQVLIRISKLFNVSTDYLLFDDRNEPSTSMKISDNELFTQFQEVDKMGEDKRELIKRIISMAINEDKIKKMVS